MDQNQNNSDNSEETQERKCVRCTHAETEHHEIAGVDESNPEKISKSGLCKVIDCQCIGFSPAEM